MSQHNQKGNGTKVGNSEFPHLRELSAGDSLTPLDPRLINPIIRAYNALRNIQGSGKTSDGLDTVKVVMAASGIVVEIVPAPKEGTNVSEIPENQGSGGSISGITYEGAWSSLGTYAEGALVIHTNGSQSGLFIRVSATSGAGTEPFTSGPPLARYCPSPQGFR